jgi:hypothetical protein
MHVSKLSAASEHDRGYRNSVSDFDSKRTRYNFLRINAVTLAHACYFDVPFDSLPLNSLQLMVLHNPIAIVHFQVPGTVDTVDSNETR